MGCVRDEFVLVRTGECHVQVKFVVAVYIANALASGLLVLYCASKLYPLVKTGNFILGFIPHTIVVTFLVGFFNTTLLFSYKAIWVIQVVDEDPLDIFLQGTLAFSFSLGIYLFIFNLIVAASSSEIGRAGGTIRKRALIVTKFGVLTAGLMGFVSFWPALFIRDFMFLGSHMLVASYMIISGTILFNCSYFTSKTVKLLTSALSSGGQAEGDRKLHNVINKIMFSNRVISFLSVNGFVSCGATLLIPFFAENTWLTVGPIYFIGATVGGAAVSTIRLDPPRSGTLPILFLTKNSEPTHYANNKKKSKKKDGTRISRSANDTTGSSSSSSSTGYVPLKLKQLLPVLPFSRSNMVGPVVPDALLSTSTPVVPAYQPLFSEAAR